jgi:hypothetical protein
MTYKKTYNIQKSNQLIINLPEEFRSKKKVRITIEDIDSEKEDKLTYIKEASRDPLFINDIEEVLSDFRNIDKESV